VYCRSACQLRTEPSLCRKHLPGARTGSKPGCFGVGGSGSDQLLSQQLPRSRRDEFGEWRQPGIWTNVGELDSFPGPASFPSGYSRTTSTVRISARRHQPIAFSRCRGNCSNRRAASPSGADRTSKSSARRSVLPETWVCGSFLLLYLCCLEFRINAEMQVEMFSR
jgi:hypothetical protein